MKKLFEVRNGKEVLFFEDKQEAKAARNSLQASGKHTAKVSVGPDHWRYKKG